MIKSIDGLFEDNSVGNFYVFVVASSACSVKFIIGVNPTGLLLSKNFQTSSVHTPKKVLKK